MAKDIPIFLIGAAGEYMETAVVVEWHARVGDAIEAGKPLVTIENAKKETEEKNAAIEEEIEVVRRANRALQDQVALSVRDRAGDAARRARLEERIEAQRDTVAEHLRRVLRADEDRARRRIEEIERDVRVARSLLVRLDEQAGGEDQEQPL